MEERNERRKRGRKEEKTVEGLLTSSIIFFTSSDIFATSSGTSYDSPSTETSLTFLLSSAMVNWSLKIKSAIQILPNEINNVDEICGGISGGYRLVIWHWRTLLLCSVGNYGVNRILLQRSQMLSPPHYLSIYLSILLHIYILLLSELFASSFLFCSLENNNKEEIWNS